jgi:hypothetical protein
MMTGGLLYLVMTIVVFVLFSVVLGYQSWRQSRGGPEMVSEPAEKQDAHQTLAA